MADNTKPELSEESKRRIRKNVCKALIEGTLSVTVEDYAEAATDDDEPMDFDRYKDFILYEFYRLGLDNKK